MLLVSIYQEDSKHYFPGSKQSTENCEDVYEWTCKDNVIEIGMRYDSGFIGSYFYVRQRYVQK